MDLRTFIAIECSGGVAGRTAALIQKLQAVGAKVSWVRAENLHFTLKFLGDVPLTATAEICSAVRSAVAGIEPFAVEVRGLSAFPKVMRPRTIWVGVEEGGEAMSALAEAVEQALLPLGYRTEGRRFKPHLTIGRVRGQKLIYELGHALAENADFEAGVMEIDELTIMSSQLNREGPQYEPLDHAPLAS